jgi:peptidoglycan/LPS O-acetylase OafA/YrhL
VWVIGAWFIMHEAVRNSKLFIDKLISYILTNQVVNFLAAISFEFYLVHPIVIIGIAFYDSVSI